MKNEELPLVSPPEHLLSEGREILTVAEAYYACRVRSLRDVHRGTLMKTRATTIDSSEEVMATALHLQRHNSSVRYHDRTYVKTVRSNSRET